MLIKFGDFKKIIKEAVEASTYKKIGDYLKKETHKYLNYYTHMTRPQEKAHGYDLPAVLNATFRYHKTDMKRDRNVRELLGQISDQELKQMSDKATLQYLKQNDLLKNLVGQS